MTIVTRAETVGKYNAFSSILRSEMMFLLSYYGIKQTIVRLLLLVQIMVFIARSALTIHAAQICCPFVRSFVRKISGFCREDLRAASLLLSIDILSS